MNPIVWLRKALFTPKSEILANQCLEILERLDQAIYHGEGTVHFLGDISGIWCDKLELGFKQEILASLHDLGLSQDKWMMYNFFKRKYDEEIALQSA